MFRKFATLFGTLIIIAGGVGLIIVMGQMRPKIEREAPELIAPTVFYEVAESQSVTLDVAAQGEVRPRTDINLTAQVAGRVVSVADAFVDGGAFDKDDVLLKIEDADYRAASASTKARVAQAEQALRLEEAEAELARRDYDELGREGTPSGLTLRVPQLAQARANFEAAQAEFRSAQLNLARTTIRAPFPGRVRERIAGVGQYVAPGAQLGRIFSTDAAEIRLALTDQDLAKLGLPIAFFETEQNLGPTVEMTAFIAGKLRKWTGRIARTQGAIDAATRQIFAIAVVDDPYGAGADKDGTPLAMGLFVDATIQGRPYENAIVLPRAALHGRDKVYVISTDNLLEERTVNVVSSDSDTVTLSSGGLTGGERVAVSPLRGSGAGDPVTPANPEAGSGADKQQTAATTSRNMISGE